jgi:hypothetical protein
MAAMKRLAATLWICFGAYCGYQTNTAPLAFGMTLEQASDVLGVPLVYLSGPKGSEIFLAYGTAGAMPQILPIQSAVALQFRKGRLTGWKKDWQVGRPFPF